MLLQRALFDQQYSSSSYRNIVVVPQESLELIVVSRGDDTTTSFSEILVNPIYI